MERGRHADGAVEVLGEDGGAETVWEQGRLARDDFVLKSNPQLVSFARLSTSSSVLKVLIATTVTKDVGKERD